MSGPGGGGRDGGVGEFGGVEARLARGSFTTDEVSHIEVIQDVARSTGTARLLIDVCPAKVFAMRPDGDLSVAHEACLECGTCLAVAAAGSLIWHYPRGGFGVAYREG